MKLRNVSQVADPAATPGNMAVDMRQMASMQRTCRGKFYMLKHGANYFLLQTPCCKLMRYGMMMCCASIILTLSMP